MTNEERRFKIKKIEKYNETINTHKENSVVCAISLGVWGMAAVMCLSLGVQLNQLLYIPAIVNAGISIVSLKKFIESICLKTQLEVDVEKLNEELEMLESTERKGMKR